jgi:hypothetical protein
MPLPIIMNNLIGIKPAGLINWLGPDYGALP